MRSLVVANGEVPQPADISALPKVVVDGVSVHCAVVHSDDMPTSLGPGFEQSVVLRTRATSLNFRDRVFVHGQRYSPPDRMSIIGSEFVAQVVATGTNVRSVAVGDRVIANNAFTGRLYSENGVRSGVPTNSGSSELQILGEGNIVKVPDAMPDSVAAAFSIGAQTAWAMVRRVDPMPGIRALVTAGSSNTSIFLIAVLLSRGVQVYATSTNRAHVERLLELGVREVFLLERSSGHARFAPMVSAADSMGGFDLVCDPFADVYAQAAVRSLRPGGSYISCGIADQTPGAAISFGAAPLDFAALWADAIPRNVSLLAHCLGSTDDLQSALDLYTAGGLPVRIDSVFGEGDGAAFLHRSFNASERFGKVVLLYD